MHIIDEVINGVVDFTLAFFPREVTEAPFIQCPRLSVL
jgi:hypothetical protein